jgi:hypothetical protein
MSAQTYFALFGAPLAVGRTFTAAEDSPNGGHVLVLSYGLWKRRDGRLQCQGGLLREVDSNQNPLEVNVARGKMYTFVVDGAVDRSRDRNHECTS